MASGFVTLHNDTAQLPTTIGQKTSAESLSVVIASDGSIPIALDNDAGEGVITADTLRVTIATDDEVNDSLASIDATLTTTNNILNAIYANTPPLGQADMATSIPVTMAVDQGPIHVFDGGGSITVDGTVAATQSGGWTVAATQSGAWNVTNISGTVTLPTGAATETTLAALNTKHVTQTLGSQAAAAGIAVTLSTRHEAAATPVSSRLSNGTAFSAYGSGANASDVLRITPATDAPHLLATRHEAVATPLAAQLSNGSAALAYDTGVSSSATLRTVLATRHESAATPISVRLSNGSSFITPAPAGRAYADSVRKDYSAGTVTTAAYTQLIASTASAINAIMLFDSSGQTLELATGAAASETRLLIIPPGGFAGPVPVTIAAGTRLSVKAISADATSGELNITGLS